MYKRHDREQASDLQESCLHDATFANPVLDNLFRESPIRSQITQRLPGLEVVHSVPLEISKYLQQSDPSTLLHSIRVSLMSRLGAELMGFPIWDHDRVELSGLAHDLGKQNPEVHDIVHNGRPLTAAERTVVNKHAHYGFEMLYESSQRPELNVKRRLGNFMGHIALDVLFSHSHSRMFSQRGVTNQYLESLVEQQVITEADATDHVANPSVQLVAVADVSDAFLSIGSERAYRKARLESEGRPAQLDPATVPNIVGEVIDVPAIDVQKVVGNFTVMYPAIQQAAQRYVRAFK